MVYCASSFCCIVKQTDGVDTSRLFSLLYNIITFKEEGLYRKLPQIALFNSLPLVYFINTLALIIIITFGFKAARNVYMLWGLEGIGGRLSASSAYVNWATLAGACMAT